MLSGNEKLKTAQKQIHIDVYTIEFLQATERFKPHYLIKSLTESMCLISISLHLLCNRLQLIFSAFTASSTIFLTFFLLLEYVKLDNSFCYQVLNEVCIFLIIFIFIILSMFVCLMYIFFAFIFIKKDVFRYKNSLGENS